MVLGNLHRRMPSRFNDMHENKTDQVRTCRITRAFVFGSKI
eukprot:SAG31_NODE_36940_length_309_cov_0.566667_1_plen_40_part_10